MLWIRKLYIFILVGQLLSLMVCCSPKTGQSVLNFFFDGVTDPDATSENAENNPDVVDLTSGPVTSTSRSGPVIEYHAPYMKRKCEFCHDENSLASLTLEEPQLCYQCHENNSGEYRFMHGPVAGGHCTVCHDPHTNKYGGLISREGQELCIHCHDAGLVFKSLVHQGKEKTECTDCHNAHGGDSRFYLNSDFASE